jgi:Spy/CpxP family protein refolding chaperone
MKKIILAAFVVVFTVSTSIAQDIPERKAEHPKMMHMGGDNKGHHMDMKALNLTDTQKEQLKTNREEFRKKMEELKKQDNISVKEWRSRMQSLKDEQKTKMQSIFTSEQKDKLAKMRTEGMEKHKETMDKRGGMMKEKLGLSDAQSAKLEKNRTEAMNKMKAIKENKSLTDEQRKEQLKELHKKQKEEMKAVLTEEQLKKLKEGHGQHHKGPRGEKKETPSKTVI